MSIAWTTVAILVLLLPGFIYFAGLISTSYFSRDVGPRSTATQLAGVVFISFIVHATLLYLNGLSCQSELFPCIDLHIVFSVLQLSDSDKVHLLLIANNISSNIIWITSYILLSCLIGYFLGKISSLVLIKTNIFKGSFDHRWSIELVSGAGVTIAHVLTKISYGGKHIMYKGILKEHYLTKEGTINYLVLVLTHRYYMALNEDDTDAAVEKQLQIVDGNKHKTDVVGTLMIPGSEIANVVFVKPRISVLARRGKLNFEKIFSIFKKIFSKEN